MQVIEQRRRQLPRATRLTSAYFAIGFGTVHTNTILFPHITILERYPGMVLRLRVDRDISYGGLDFVGVQDGHNTARFLYLDYVILLIDNGAAGFVC
jgi:hypothetical protein